MTDWSAEDLEHLAGVIAEELDYLTAEAKVGRVAFAVLTFDVGAEGSMAYASNVPREDMIAALEDLLVKLRGES